MVMEDNESCASRVIFDALPTSQATMDRRERIKMEVFDEVLRRLRQSDIEDAHLPGFEDDLWNHFNRLPARFLPCFFFFLHVVVPHSIDD